MPVFAKEGAIIPLADGEIANSTDNPTSLEIRVYGGADGAFTMVEDNGKIKDALECTRTEFSFEWGEKSIFTISSPKSGEGVPSTREYKVRFVALGEPTEVLLNGENIGFNYDFDTRTVVIDSFEVSEASVAEITVKTDGKLPANEIKNSAEKILLSLREINAKTLAVLHRIIASDFSASAKVSEVFSLDISDVLKNALLEILTEH